ncbi:3-hydroxyacyl-CoA dehydrogenase family protein [Fusibacter sp. 3D3]|uniref:3-hydroxyacyl-CoA dehydrogenase family protein n=1 Tax=Fusibacter sp. 3D3 TaxID=1048380 RepID=UPI0008535CCB|nr:3-hydroxyacyl-CoA dehydrogenase family protein [Fusibacter sp. 3D3]GAU76876.1 3-hydroxybutyryl-CoA dehydrogenase [Fusibacter sp. 3D3]
MAIKNVTILGSGLMGNGLAQVFAMDPNTTVILRSRSIKEAPLKPVQDNLKLLVEKEALTKAEADAILSRISFTDDLEASLKEADLIVECVVEDMEIKQNLFRDIEPLCKADAIFATNTSVMSITEIAKKTKDKSRVIGTHFWNPPFLIPLVEVVKGDETSMEVMDETYDYLKKIGKKPVKCMKDVPGFIANRLQHAIWREALSIVENGIADAPTVDEALRYGPGLRWPILGILENADMIGLDLSYNIQNYIVKYLEDAHEPSKLLKSLVDQGDLGFKTGKGYQEWTPEQIAASNKRLREYLIDVTKDLK